MSKIHILADTSADLTAEEAKEFDIRLLPFRLTLEDGKEYNDRLDITPEELYKNLRETNQSVKTVQITPLGFEEYFREEAALGYEELVVVTIASTASGTYQSAMLAKGVVEEENLIKVHVVDSMNLSYGTGYAVIQGAKALKDGASGEEVAKIIKETVDSSKSYFTVETLDYLRKGGRIKAATAVIGGMLDIRPILTVHGGLVDSVDKVRGGKKVVPKFISLLKEGVADFEDFTLIFLDGDAKEMLDAMNEAVLAEFGKKADIIRTVGATIGAHAGPGVFGFCFLPKK